MPENVTVTAGLGGFLAFFILAIALWLLMRNMNGRLRRMRYREEERLKAAAKDPAAPGDPSGQEP